MMLEIAERFPIKHGFSVKNSVEFAEKVQSTRLRCEEAMVSFDVLFPSVPVDKALQFLETHLRKEACRAKKTLPPVVFFETKPHLLRFLYVTK